MDLLEKFFGTIIPVSLDEPTHATIELKGNARNLSAIVIPRIDSEGRLVFAFYDAVQTWDGNANSRDDMALPVTVRFRNGQGIQTLLTDLKEEFLLSEKEKRLCGQLIVVQPEVSLRDEDIVYADFCVEDFPLFFGTLAFEKTEISDSQAVYGGRSRILGRSTFESHGWRFTISECPDKGEMGITHSGSIARSDGGAFSVRQLNDVIDGLTYFLSFISGVYRTPGVVIGYSSLGSPAWGRIASFKQNKYHGDNWFNPQSREAIATLFPGFWRCLVENLQDVHGAIGSYAESSIIAHAGLPKNALNDSQTALEGLSRWILGRKKPRRQPAREYIKEALDCVGITYGLHEHPSLLRLWREKYKKDQDDDDGPTLITRLRNKSIHADVVQSRSSDYYSAWNLSQRYVELMLLWLFDYHQEYFDRASGHLLLVPFHAKYPLRES